MKIILYEIVSYIQIMSYQFQFDYEKETCFLSSFVHTGLESFNNQIRWIQHKQE